MINQKRRNNTDRFQHSLMNDMLDFIEANLDTKLSVAEFGARSGYSHWYFHRLFKEWFNTTPAQYMLRRQVTELALVLPQHRGNLATLVLSWGFGSMSGFSRAFKRQTGLTPLAVSRGVVRIPPAGIQARLIVPEHPTRIYRK